MTTKKETILQQLKGKAIVNNMLDGVRIPSLTIWSMLKQGLIKMVGKNKYTLPALLIFICSCTKQIPAPAPVQHKQFTAVMNMQPGYQYDIYVTNDTTLNPLQWNIWVARSLNGKSVEFDFAGYVCMDYTVDPKKPMYGIAIDNLKRLYKYAVTIKQN